MIDLASIRNASFTLTPTGYNPEEVDRFLADLADQLADGLAVAPAPEPQYEAPQTFEAPPAPVIELRRRANWGLTKPPNSPPPRGVQTRVRALAVLGWLS